MTFLAYGIVALVALQRLVEVIYANRNTKRLLAGGAVETGRAHYPLIVLMHIGWLAAVAITLPQPVRVLWTWLLVFVALQAARLWVIVSLGPYWTTRVITLNGAPLVRRGPYRFLKHPNYAIVVLEIAVLPLAFREYRVAIIFSLINAGLLGVRIAVEDGALAARRRLATEAGPK
jgi:methyltransferase